MFSLTQSLVVISTLFAATLALPDNCSRTYSVKPGDTCDAIAAAQGVSTYQIMTVNSVTVNPACTNILPGETICLAVKGQDCQPVAVVQMGNSCSSIAAGAGISVSTLLANNPNVGSGCELLYPGEVVCVDSQVVVKSN